MKMLSTIRERHPSEAPWDDIDEYADRLLRYGGDGKFITKEEFYKFYKQ